MTTSAIAAITFGVTSPTPNAVEGTSLSVSVVVNSTYLVQTVSAQAGGGTMASLTAPSSVGAAWTGAIDIGALAYGSQVLSITATDALNNMGSATVSFFHHNPPVIQVTSPTNWAVARPSIDLSATCSDATGCVNFQAVATTAIGTAVLTSGTSSITLSGVSLAQFEGQQVTVTFSAQDQDASGATLWDAASNETVYVDTSASYVPVNKVPGLILDFDATRILYTKYDGSVALGDRVAQTEMVIGSASWQAGPDWPNGTTITSGFLTSTGAAWTQPASISGASCEQIMAWVPSSTVNLTATSPPIHGECYGALAINGDWAAVRRVPPKSTNGI